MTKALTARPFILTQRLDAGLRAIKVAPSEFHNMPRITPQLQHIASVLKGLIGVERRPAREPVVDDDGNVVVEGQEAEQPPLPPIGHKLDKDWPVFLEASSDFDCRKVLTKYRECPQSFRGHLPIEAYCCAAKVPSGHVLDHLILQVIRQGTNAAALITGLNQPRIVQRTVEMALRDEGTSDRALFHKASGWTPTPKSAQTNITVTQAVQASSSAAAVAAPPPEATIRRLSDRFNEAPRLVAPAPNVPVAEDAQIVEDEEEDEAE